MPPARVAEKLVIPAGGDKVVAPRGAAGVPVLNTTAVGIAVTAFGTGSGAVQVHPTRTTAAPGPTVSYVPDTETTGFTLAKLGDDGKVNLHNTGSSPVTVWVDVLSYTELVDRRFPTPATVGEAIENITITSKTDDSGTTTVKVPRVPQQGIKVTTDAGTITLGLPASGAATRTSGGTIVYDGTSANHSIGVQPTTDGGFRTFAHLDDATAPTSYSFPLDLPTGTRPAIDELDGSALIVKEHASTTEPAVLLEEVTRIQKPWAKDANGRTWPTSYAIAGDTLKLTVDLPRSPTPPAPRSRPASPWSPTPG